MTSCEGCLLFTFVKEINNEWVYCVIIIIVSERVNKNQQNFRIICAIW